MGELGVDRVDLVERDHLRLVPEAGAIGVELAPHRAPGGGDVLVVGVDEMDQHPGALDMAEEAVADAGALGRALDQAGNVGEHEVDALVTDDAELGMKRRERIVADLGLGVGDGVEEGRLAGIGQPDQPGVGDQLEAKPHPQLRARPAGAVLARRAIGGGLEAGIAAAALAALQQHDPLADLGEVGEDMRLVLAEHLGADRDPDGEIATARAGLVAAGAALAAQP